MTLVILTGTVNPTTATMDFAEVDTRNDVYKILRLPNKCFLFIAQIIFHNF